MEIVKAHSIDTNIDDDDETYKISLNMVQVDRIDLSIFNTKSGITFKTFIDKGSEWYNDNIYVCRGDFSHLYNILQKAVGYRVKKSNNLNYTIIDNKDKIILKIIYNNDMFPFNLSIDVPRYISEKGELEDRINSLEYQVERLRSKLNNKTIKVNGEKINDIGEIYNIYGHLIYKGGMKNGKPHGKGIQYFQDAEVIQYEGEFKNGLYDGHGILTNNGTGNTLNGQKPLSSKYVGNFCKGLKNGELLDDNPNGNKYYSNYKKGVLHGLQKTINQDGSINTHYYKDGVMDGELKIVDKDGNIISSRNYVNGVQV